MILSIYPYHNNSILITPCCWHKQQALTAMKWKRGSSLIFLCEKKENAAWGTVLFKGSFPKIWRRKWQPTSVFLPREFCGWMSLVGPSPWDCKVSDVTEQLTLTFTFCCGICSMNLLFLTTTSWLVYSDTITTCLLLVGECYFRWSLMCMDGVEWVSLQSVRLSVSKSPVQSFKL